MRHARADYDRIQDPWQNEPGGIAADEPVFIIRAKDMNAPAAVRAWANIAEENGAAANIIDLARDQARAMEAWQEKNELKIPDL